MAHTILIVTAFFLVTLLCVVVAFQEREETLISNTPVLSDSHITVPITYGDDTIIW